MHLHQAVKKLSRNTAEVYNPTTNLWEGLGFKVMLPVSGRWVARTPDFSENRLCISPFTLPDYTRLIRFTSNPADEFLIYAVQQNIQANRSYLWDYTLKQAEVNYAQVIEMVPQVMASGVSGKKVENVVGSFPIYWDRLSSESSPLARDMMQSKFIGYIPHYSGLHREHIIRWDYQGKTYEWDVKEVVPEILLLKVVAVAF